jgi:predicted PurR-regulated permease PerM
VALSASRWCNRSWPGWAFWLRAFPLPAFLSFIALVLAIIQIGPAILFVPIVVWSWTAMETSSALMFTAYMVPVGLVDNVLRPLVMARGLTTPMLVIFIGVVGGTLAYGISGLYHSQRWHSSDVPHSSLVVRHTR